MQRSVLFWFILFFNCSLVFSQDSLNVSQSNIASIQTIYHRSGLFIGVNGSANLHKGIMLNISLGTGLRSLSLGHFKPIMSAGMGYDLFRKKELICLAPGLRGQLISSRLSSDNNIRNLEGMVGYDFSLGSKLKLIQGAYYGLGSERSHSYRIDYNSYLIYLGFGYSF